MALPVWAIPAGISAAQAFAQNYFARKNRTPRFQDTAYGQYLQKMSKVGRYSPGTERKMIGRVSGTAGNIAQGEKTELRGYLESRGMGGSMAGTRTLKEPGMEHMRTVSDYTKQLDIGEESTKSEAAGAFARGRTETGDIRRREKMQMTGDLIGGLAETGMSAYGAYQAKEAKEEALTVPNFAEMSPEEVLAWANTRGIPAEQALNAWKLSIAKKLGLVGDVNAGQ